MGADKGGKFALFLLLILSLPALGESKSIIDNDAEVLKILKDSLANSIVALEKQIEHCSKQSRNQSPILIDKSKVEHIKENKDDFIIGISHFYFKNMLECEKAARSLVSFDLGMLISFKEQLNISSEQLKEIQNNLVLQPIEQINYQVDYNELDPGLKKYLSEKFIGKPFELFRVLNDNGLSYE